MQIQVAICCFFNIGMRAIKSKFSEIGETEMCRLKRPILDTVTEDSELAHRVCGMDDAVDAINREMYITIQGAIGCEPDNMESLIHLLSVSRHLERIADLATNIAEDVIYMIEGERVRHRAEKYM